MTRIEQGDGVRSFVGTLLHGTVLNHEVLIVDEPEAFLHPPQARLLGMLLASKKKERTQLFLATHSNDFLRGLLDGAKAPLLILRLTREPSGGGEINRCRKLEYQQLRDIWGNTLLRASNALDGLFHELVVVCESDSDCRFYSSVLEAYVESRTNEVSQPDVMFFHCGGKSRMPVVLRALRAFGVPTKAVVDFDVAKNEDGKFREIFEALGGTWANIEDDLNTVVSEMNSMPPQPPKLADVKQRIDELLAGVAGATLPGNVAKRLREAVKVSDAWRRAKAEGTAILNGTPAEAAVERLSAACAAVGLHIVDGETERFVPSVEGHGPQWVADVLDGKDLATEAELDNARAFVRQVCGLPDSGATKEETGDESG